MSPDPTTAIAPPPIETPVHRIFTATLIIGRPGSGKTSLLATFAEYLWEVYKRILLLYSTDGGAIPIDVQKRMKQGLIRFWRMRTRSAEGLGLETLYLGTKGYWPRHINPETGECSPAAELVPPVTVRYTVHCVKGHLLQSNLPSRALVQSVFCKDCNAIQPDSHLIVQESITRTKGFEQVGGVGYDGLTSMTNMVMDHMDHARGAGQIGGEKPAFGGVVTSGVIKLGGNNRADVGFGQTRGRQFVDNSLSIPYLVEGPVFTGLTNETTDEGGLPIVGLKLPGQAATDESIGWFGNVMEMGESLDDAGKKHYTLYLRPYTDPQNRRHLLKTSSSVFGVPDKLVDPDVDAKKPFEQANLGLVFRMLDEDLRRAVLQQVIDGPGAPPSDYGEDVQPTPAPTAPSPGPQQLSLTPPAATGTPVAAAAVTPAAGAAPVMVPRASRRRAPGPTEPAPTPATVPMPLAAAAPPVATVAPPVMPAPATTLPTAGTAPPPPVGAKPPQRAPGT